MMTEKKTTETKGAKAPPATKEAGMAKEKETGAGQAASPAATPAAKAPAGVAKRVAGEGNTVRVHYKGTLSDGSVFDTSEGREPISFTIGGRQVVPGFESAVRGMKVGDKKTVSIKPSEAYGDRNPQLIQKVPVSVMKQSGITPEKGMVLGLRHPQHPEMQLPATIVEVGEKEVSLDLNHPLAGKDLTFEVELVSVD
jgi:FKBP-type peptidyl-prolyl cis-trans isomerase 2